MTTTHKFPTPFSNYACAGDTIATEIDGFLINARLVHDQDSRPEDDEGFWPSNDPKAAGYVFPENYASQMEYAVKVKKAWDNEEWFYAGVVLSVWKNGIKLSDHAASLYGVECNYPAIDGKADVNEYVNTVANDLIDEALEEANKIIKVLAKPENKLLTALQAYMHDEPFIGGQDRTAYALAAIAEFNGK